eukprot:gene10611-biopygen3510
MFPAPRTNVAVPVSRHQYRVAVPLLQQQYCIPSNVAVPVLYCQVTVPLCLCRAR